MSDLISRTEAIEIIASHDETNGTEKVFTGREITDLLATLPSADRPKSEWIPIAEETLWRCKNCNQVVGNRYNYCHNCGSEMKNHK